MLPYRPVTPPWKFLGLPRALEMTPDGSNGRTNNVSMEPIWRNENVNTTYFFLLYLKPWASSYCPGLIIWRLSSQSKFALIFHVETTDPHPPMEDHGSPQGARNESRWARWTGKKCPNGANMNKWKCWKYIGFSTIFEVLGLHTWLRSNWLEAKQSSQERINFSFHLETKWSAPSPSHYFDPENKVPSPLWIPYNHLDVTS